MFIIGRPTIKVGTTRIGENCAPVTNDERSTLARLLQSVRDGAVSIDEASAYLGGHRRDDAFDYAELDHLRSERTGFAEVILAEGKTPRQVAEIAVALHARAGTVMATRVTREHFDEVKRESLDAVHHDA